MLPYALNKIDATALAEICRQQFAESGTLDFKRTIPGRDGGGTFEIAKDVSAFANADGGDQARQFFAKRIQTIERGETWRAMLPDRPIAVFDFVPLSGLAGRVSIDMGGIEFTKFMTWEDGSANAAINLDGLVAYNESSERLWGFSQAYRNGCVESILVVGWIGRDGRTGVWRERAERFYIRALECCAQAAQRWELAGPAILQCALLNVGDCVLETGTAHDYISRKTADRPHLVFPEIWIEDISSPLVASDVLDETHSVLTQSFGFMPGRRRS
jgi:hypothetical protein